MSLRLYGRGRGPADICKALNEHREIDPPYLRNTCSVKCVTAQRRGIERYGEDWCDQLKHTFSQIDDDQATRLLRVDPNDGNDPEDVDVLTLCRNLKKHPEDPNNPGSYGLFARCVMWCEQNNQSWMLSEIHELARALETGREPQPNVTMETSEIMSLQSFLNDEPMDHAEMSQQSSQLSSPPTWSSQEEQDVAAHENGMGGMALSGDAMVGETFGGQMEV